MIDYLAWAKADPLTVEQAARLWAEVDPSTPQYMWTPAQSAAIGARLQMLFGRITTRELQVNHSANGLEFIGRYERSTILRSELEALAARLGERPRFLFAAANEKPGEGEKEPSRAEASEPELAPASTGHQTGLDKAAISQLFGPEITKTSDSSPPPLRVVPSARRISKAPPPPHYVGGTVMWPALANAPALPPEDRRKPTQAASEVRRPPDRAGEDSVADEKTVRAWLVVEQARRIKEGEQHGLSQVRLFLKDEFPHLSRQDADRFYEGLDKSLKPRSGPRGPWKNKR